MRIILDKEEVEIIGSTIKNIEQLRVKHEIVELTDGSMSILIDDLKFTSSLEKIIRLLSIPMIGKDRNSTVERCIYHFQHRWFKTVDDEQVGDFDKNKVERFVNLDLSKILKDLPDLGQTVIDMGENVKLIKTNESITDGDVTIHRVIAREVFNELKKVENSSNQDKLKVIDKTIINTTELFSEYLNDTDNTIESIWIIRDVIDNKQMLAEAQKILHNIYPLEGVHKIMNSTTYGVVGDSTSNEKSVLKAALIVFDTAGKTNEQIHKEVIEAVLREYPIK